MLSKKKLLALGIAMVFLVSIAILPITAAQDSMQKQKIDQIKNKIISDAPKFEDAFPQVKNFSIDVNSDFVCSPDSFIKPASITMTDQEIRESECFPGYYTPNQISTQEVVSKKSGQMTILDTPQQPVSTIIIVDDEMLSYYVAADPWGATWLGLEIWANNILEGGDDYLESPYGIDFQTNWNYIMYWDTPDYMTYANLLDEMTGDPDTYVDPTAVWCDVIVVMSGQYGGAYQGGGEILGMANPMYYRNGRHFVMNACMAMWGAPPANIFQHEASHLFDCSDHQDWTYCVMCYTYFLSYRGYCTGCNTQLLLNAARFD